MCNPLNSWQHQGAAETHLNRSLRHTKRGVLNLSHQEVADVLNLSDQRYFQNLSAILIASWSIAQVLKSIFTQVACLTPVSNGCEPKRSHVGGGEREPWLNSICNRWQWSFNTFSPREWASGGRDSNIAQLPWRHVIRVTIIQCSIVQLCLACHKAGTGRKKKAYRWQIRELLEVFDQLLKVLQFKSGGAANIWPTLAHVRFCAREQPFVRIWSVCLQTDHLSNATIRAFHSDRYKTMIKTHTIGFGSIISMSIALDVHHGRWCDILSVLAPVHWLCKDNISYHGFIYGWTERYSPLVMLSNVWAQTNGGARAQIRISKLPIIACPPLSFPLLSTLPPDPSLSSVASSHLRSTLAKTTFVDIALQ